MTEEDKRPHPLVPPETDLRGYDFMPFYGEFLRTSEFNSRVTDAEYRAGVNLWWSSWWQVPASSLPNDEAQLCKLADLGRDMRRWKKVRTQALSGFVLCSDNRWYHSFLSVAAREAYAKRKTAGIKGALGASKRWKNNDHKYGSGNATANATAKEKNSWGNSTGNASSIPPAIENDSNRREVPITNTVSSNTSPVDNYKPHVRSSTSKPTTPAHSTANVEQNKRELEEAAQHAAPIPEEIRAKFVKPKPKTFDELDS